MPTLPTGITIAAVAEWNGEILGGSTTNYETGKGRTNIYKNAV